MEYLSKAISSKVTESSSQIQSVKYITLSNLIQNAATITHRYSNIMLFIPLSKIDIINGSEKLRMACMEQEVIIETTNCLTTILPY